MDLHLCAEPTEVILYSQSIQVKDTHIAFKVSVPSVSSFHG